MDIKDVDIKEIEEFETVNLVWQVVKTIIFQRLELVRDELELGHLMGKAEGFSLEEIIGRQKECVTMRWLLQLPQILIELKKEELKEDGRLN
jgi:hypothetical protein